MPNFYPRLPELTPRAPGETAEAYGLRAFGFVLATDTTATVDDAGLQLAAHCYRVIIANRDLLPASLDRLADVDRQIARALRFRARLAQDAAAISGQRPEGPKAGPGGPTDDDRPDGGHLARLKTGPRTQPPAPAHAVPTPTPTATPRTTPTPRIPDFAF